MGLCLHGRRTSTVLFVESQYSIFCNSSTGDWKSFNLCSSQSFPPIISSATDYWTVIFLFIIPRDYSFVNCSFNSEICLAVNNDKDQSQLVLFFCSMVYFILHFASGSTLHVFTQKEGASLPKLSKTEYVILLSREIN